MSIKELYKLFKELETISSRNIKEALVKQNDCDDLTYALEILNGEHKLGYTVFIRDPEGVLDYKGSLRDFLKPFYQLKDHSDSEISRVESQFKGYGYFIMPLLNRTFRLGIGKSQLKTKFNAPQLAKKFEYGMKCPRQSVTGYYITEKLDGNRCLASFNKDKQGWEFTSRSGKSLNVQFDMSTYSTDLVFDGEILSKEQIANPGQRNFNTLSGIINSDNGDKSQLVYCIFDFISNSPYVTRRALLNLMKETENVIILPVLAQYTTWEELNEKISEQLNYIVDLHGEGVMINIGDAPYEQKRTSSLLKLKQVQTMDMKVIDITEGTGKNEGCVGALVCEAREGKNLYTCQVGSGLNDYQRMNWADNPNNIIGKIVEVAYFSTSQDKLSDGTNVYSLRFPRLKGIRKDKDTTSVY
jgi:DNA ligase 1